MKIIYRITADTLWLIHFLVVLVVLFGWAFPRWWSVYMIILGLTLVSEIFWNYCILSKWEYDLRKKIDPLLHYEYAYASYYTYRLTQGRLSHQFLGRVGLAFTSLSLALNIYFRYFFSQS